MRKEEVFVRVSSEKKARKLKELLEMFGENVFSPDSIDEALARGWGLHNDGEEWLNISSNRYNKTKVSLKELRNILAVEHLKEGDVVVAKCGSQDYIVVFESFVKNQIEGCYIYESIDGRKLTKETGYFDNFIRYATEEEKALLEPKKELEVGKWYTFTGHKVSNKPLMYITGYTESLVNFKGFNCYGKWTDSDYYSLYDLNTLGYTEAMPEEVEQALIKEAERRYKVGDVIDQSEIYTPVVRKKTITGIEEFRFGHINKDSVEVLTGICAETVFKNGKWAEVIKPEKSLEERVKELEERVKELESM